MIKIQTLDKIENIEHIVKPTIFPDGTSQVWHLPEEIIKGLNVKVTWNFESEQEFFYLASLRKLIYNYCHLHIPYLPYARQDKYSANYQTFNLTVFAELLNAIKFNLVTAVDVHNPDITKKLIENFVNLKVDNFIEKSFNFIKTDGIVFPDRSAFNRYRNLNNFAVCNKTRDQKTGKIYEHYISEVNKLNINTAKRVLLVDDICDGGATFISIAKMLKEINSELFIDLYVTHGIFSKGKQVLHDAGIQNIYCTNSLLKNADGFKV